jgi:hypothetical protein
MQKKSKPSGSKEPANLASKVNSLVSNAEHFAKNAGVSEDVINAQRLDAEFRQLVREQEKLNEELLTPKPIVRVTVRRSESSPPQTINSELPSRSESPPRYTPRYNAQQPVGITKLDIFLLVSLSIALYLLYVSNKGQNDSIGVSPNLKP